MEEAATKRGNVTLKAGVISMEGKKLRGKKIGENIFQYLFQEILGQKCKI